MGRAPVPQQPAALPGVGDEPVADAVVRHVHRVRAAAHPALARPDDGRCAVHGQGAPLAVRRDGDPVEEGVVRHAFIVAQMPRTFPIARVTAISMSTRSGLGSGVRP
ncbi:hypothetical protein GCM10010357_01710 [Streptomyces luteireticuli]|uniref:Uncharacterized protein n=1 Tax=Streptomyces luteireticuli TaxID=173858 RepID=A0ABN0Y606_9ACTN